MYYAIETRYVPATNTRGARVKAWLRGGDLKLTTRVTYMDDATPEANHTNAAYALRLKLHPYWHDSVLVGGALENGYIFVLDERRFNG